MKLQLPNFDNDISDMHWGKNLQQIILGKLVFSIYKTMKLALISHCAQNSTPMDQGIEHEA